MKSRISVGDETVDVTPSRITSNFPNLSIMKSSKLRGDKLRFAVSAKLLNSITNLGWKRLIISVEPSKTSNSKPSTSTFIMKKRLHDAWRQFFQAKSLFARIESMEATLTFCTLMPFESASERRASVSAWPFPLFVLKYNWEFLDSEPSPTATLYLK